MKVTIITVAYNSASTIADTLKSVATQSYSDIEHIVIDGGSKDTTMDIVRSEGQHLARVVSESDNGIYDAMNKGMALATGDLVGFLNADDVLDGPGAISRMVNAAKGCDAVYADLVYVRGSDLNSVTRHWHSGEFRLARLRFGWMPPHPTFYVRTSLLRQVGYFDTTYRIAADYDFMLRCLTLPTVRVGYVPQVMVRMRTGGVSNASATSMLRKSREDLRAMRSYHVGGLLTLVSKNLRKLPQFIASIRSNKNHYINPPSGFGR